MNADTNVGETLVRVVALSNRVVCVGFLVTGGLLAGGFSAVAWVPGWENPGHVAVGAASVLGIPTLAAGVVAGGAGLWLYFTGRLERFWETVVPLNLGFLCLSAAFFSMPPPPAAGAAVPAVLGVLCGAILLRWDGPSGRWALLALLTLPFLGIFRPLAYWAPLVAGVVFGVMWGFARVRRPASP